MPRRSEQQRDRWSCWACNVRLIDLDEGRDHWHHKIIEGAVRDLCCECAGHTPVEPLRRIRPPEDENQIEVVVTTTDALSARPRREISRPCICGCGSPTKGTFAPGHDARVKGWLMRVAKGEMERDELPTQAVEWGIEKGYLRA